MIKDLSDLRRLLKLCREQGIAEMDCLGIKFILGDLPIEKHQMTQADPVDPYKNFPQGDLTPEQLMFYSSGGLPENDPALSGGGN